MKKETVESSLQKVFLGLTESDLPAEVELSKGKVRDIVFLDGNYILVTTDRISAFDRVLSTIPFKGQVLNQMSMYWFKGTRNILPNHIENELSDRSVVVKKCRVLPVEVVVRSYLTGSAWRDYQKTGEVSGIKLPSGMRLNQKFEQPLLTPSTKAEQGEHDRPISSKEIVESGLIEESLWHTIVGKAQELFAYGQKVASERGLILVDTKYEFGLRDDTLVLVDELHTPDSSRYWFEDTYEELFEKNEPQRKIDKEYLRQWLMDQGFSGEGAPPSIPDRVRVEVAMRYIQAYELITGRKFEPTIDDAEAEKKKITDYIRSQ